MLKNLDILKVIIECAIVLLRDVSVDLVSYNTSFQYTHCIAMSFYEMMLLCTEAAIRRCSSK